MRLEVEVFFFGLELSSLEKEYTNTAIQKVLPAVKVRSAFIRVQKFGGKTKATPNQPFLFTCLF